MTIFNYVRSSRAAWDTWNSVSKKISHLYVGSNWTGKNGQEPWGESKTTDWD